MKPKFKLKSGVDLELSVLLQKKFFGKKSSEVGRPFENLIVKYFSGGFEQTNVGTVESAFSDVRQRNTYYSVKYSKAVESKTLADVTGDNFRRTTIAHLISQVVLASEGEFTNALSEIQSLEGLKEFMKGRKISDNKYGIIAGYTFKDGDSIILKVQYSNILTGKKIYDKLLKFYRPPNISMNKKLRTHIVTSIFGNAGTKEFKLPAGDSTVGNIKDEVEKLIINEIFTSRADIIDAIKKLPSKVALLK